MSTISSSPFGGPFSWLAKLFGFHRDKKSPAIMKTLHLLTRMIDDLEVSRRRMEDRYKDLAKKARDAALRGDRDNHNIFLNEMGEISKFIALVIHAKKSLMQIKLRLETMVEMGDTLDQLPEIMAELNHLKPLLARVTPDLLDRMTELEKSVANIVSATSIPNIYGSVKPVASEQVDYNLSELLPPNKPPVEARAASTSKPLFTNRVSIQTIKNWLLEEIMITNGFLDIEAFTRKYKVPKEAVLEALNALSEEGRIVIKK